MVHIARLVSDDGFVNILERKVETLRALKTLNNKGIEPDI